MASNSGRMFRYTNLASLFHILSTKKITLLNPEKWDDQNDAFYLEEYRRRKKCESILALCFTTAPETYHQWKVFSGSESGVLIRFHREKLFDSLNSDPSINHKNVQYIEVKNINKELQIDKMPFIKRHPYRDEQEYRAICLSKNKIEFKSIAINLDAIEKIVLNPWINKELFETVKAVIKSIPECTKLKVYQTTIINNKGWRDSVMSVLGR